VTDRTAVLGNADVDWDAFDSSYYFEHNYGRLRPDDAEIIRLVTGFFSRHLTGRHGARAIDVGTGPNLYPALTMLPFAAEVVLLDRSQSNRRWLTDQLRRPVMSWRDFWDAARSGGPPYERLENPLESLSARATLVDGDLFVLPPGQFDLGTMFFVAAEITGRYDEFRLATHRFVGSLTPGAPFAAAFMRNSAGCMIGGQYMPACSIDETDVRQCLSEVADLDDVRVVNSRDLRAGYADMIVATGFAPG
jgi:hypothetical protein